MPLTTPHADSGARGREARTRQDAPRHAKTSQDKPRQARAPKIARAARRRGAKAPRRILPLDREVPCRRRREGPLDTDGPCLGPLPPANADRWRRGYSVAGALVIRAGHWRREYRGAASACRGSCAHRVTRLYDSSATPPPRHSTCIGTLTVAGPCAHRLMRARISVSLSSWSCTFHGPAQAHARTDLGGWDA